MSHSVNDEAVYRTAPATPGLLMIGILLPPAKGGGVTHRQLIDSTGLGASLVKTTFLNFSVLFERQKTKAIAVRTFRKERK